MLSTAFKVLDEETLNRIKNFDITISRVVSREDYKDCLEIRRRVFIEKLGISECHERRECGGSGVYFIAHVNGYPAGTGRFRAKKCCLKFERIAILPQLCRRGVGRALMLEMQHMGHREYPRYLQIMHAQENAIPFYKKLGWVVVGDSFVEAHLKHYILLLPPDNDVEVRNLLCLKDPRTPQAIIDYLTIREQLRF